MLLVHAIAAWLPTGSMRLEVAVMCFLSHAVAKPRTADSYANISGVPLWGQQHYVNGYRCADGTTVPRARVTLQVG